MEAEELLKMVTPLTNGVIVAILIGIITLILLLYLLLRGSTSKRPNILLTGLCDSGKTLLFTQLTQNAFRLTHTSMQENHGVVKIKGTDVAIVDLPGHDRKRQQLFEKYSCTARGIVFLIDSTTVVKELKDVAEYLYTLLTEPDIQKAKVPVMIACNKQDVGFTKSATVIKSLLEKELNTVRKTRAGGLEGTDGSSGERCHLGNDQVDFEFDQLLPQKIDIIECSAKGRTPNGEEPEIDDIQRWLQTL